MRKHDVRKWLHAILDLLPVILIPVFMIYSHRHIIDSGFIDVPQNEVVDFNQLVINGDFTSNQGWERVNSTYTIADNKAKVVSSNGYTPFGVYKSIPNIDSSHEILIRFDIENHSSSDILYGSMYGGTNNQFVNPIGLGIYHISHVYTGIGSSNFNFTIYLSGTAPSIDQYFYLYNVNIFDLTQMFGSGNEPTAQEFDTYYTDNFYEYTLSRKELVKGVHSITYADTDIMSQVVYQLYNSVDKYFNMGNVFNMTGVYDWFNLNIFNGNAPISIYIVWNIVLYEFVMDLLFLLYGLFMWFIDMVEKLMEKPLKSVK